MSDASDPGRPATPKHLIQPDTGADFSPGSYVPTVDETSLPDLESRGQIRLLCVDDDPDILQLIADSLMQEFEVITCHNGYEALEQVDEIQPDLIITDVMMPGLNGIDAIRAIKKDAQHAQTPVLYLTAKSDNATMREGLIAGGDLFLEKPFLPGQLLERVRRYCRDQKVSPRRRKKDENEVRLARKPVAAEPRTGPTTPRGLSLLKPISVREELTGHSPTQPMELIEKRADATTGESSPPLVPTIEVSAKAGINPAQKVPGTGSVAGRLRLLCIDDDMDLLGLYDSILSKYYEVITTIDSEAAPEKIIAYQPDVILLDVQMPRLNGIHLMHLIRLNRRLKGARIVYVSGLNDRETIQQLWRLGASEFIEKPFTAEILLRKLDNVVRHPDFQQSRKRLDYREVCRREGRANG
jgi:DNA-binding response OmpR family regulator